MVVCCVEHCGLTTDDNVILFEFPTSRLLRKRWLDAINPGSKIADDAKICSKHFSRQDYEEVRGKTRLKGKVVPSRFGEQMETEEESSQDLDTELNKQEKTSRNSHNDNHEDKSHNDIDKLFNGSDNSRNNSDNSGKSDNDSDYDGKPRKRKRGRPKKSKNTKNLQLKIKFNKRTTNNTCDNKNSDNNEINHSTNDEDTEITENNHDDKSHNDNNDTDNRNKTIENGHSSKISRERDKSPQSMPADIEDIISKYQIENKKTERQLAAMAQELLMQAADPVFIELQVSQDPQDQPSNDCLMLLESVQVEVDPTLMLEARAEDEECMEHVDLDADSGGEEGKKKPDGFHQPEISLLTSSDEDDVIIQEPKIDTVEVSDETDEDDVPLVKLVKSESKAQKLSKKKKKSLISRILWKGSDEVYCFQCRHVSESRSEHKKHLQTHSKVIQICQDCGFTTCSKSQLYRHRRKHKNEKKHKCPLCNYSARHSMSLIYHLKTHKENDKDVFVCENCDFVSPVKSGLTKHKQGCSRSKFSCLSCEYTSATREQVQRHEHRAHRPRRRAGRTDSGGGSEVHSVGGDSTNAEDED